MSEIKKRKSMYDKFRITEEEFMVLDKKFRDLCRYQAWQLLRRNTHNNHTDELEDVEQELIIDMIKAGVYYKRQTYIEDCLEAVKKYANDATRSSIEELDDLWCNRKKHGANKQRFGERQEAILDEIVMKIVPESERPNPKRFLILDKKFATYCKQITWNRQKSLGRKITKERSIRSGMASLSEYEFVGNLRKCS